MYTKAATGKAPSIRGRSGLVNLGSLGDRWHHPQAHPTVLTFLFATPEGNYIKRGPAPVFISQLSKAWPSEGVWLFRVELKRTRSDMCRFGPQSNFESGAVFCVVCAWDQTGYFYWVHLIICGVFVGYYVGYCVLLVG